MALLTARVTARLGRPARAVGSAHAQQMERSGLLLALCDAEGTVGYGEASPLPGFSLDDVPRCATALEPIAARGLDVDLDAPEIEPELGRISATLPRDCPAARCALEAAVLDLCGKLRGEPAWRLLAGDRAPERLALAALLRTDTELALFESADRALERGIGAVKVKLGFSTPSVETERLRRLREHLGPKIPMRLDANAAWSATEALSRLTELAPICPEFVEQPVPTQQLDRLDRSAVPLALDEALIELDPEELARVVDRIPVHVLVLKPMAIGGLVRCLELGRWATRRGIDVVVSHLFDGPVGLATAASLALAIGSRERAAGLDPHPGLDAWPRAQLPMFGAGALLRVDRPGLGVVLEH